MRDFRKVHLVKSYMVTPDNSGITTPVGLMYLAGMLRSRGDWDIRITDSRLHWGDMRIVVDEIKAFGPHVVGLSAITMEAPYMHRLAAEIRRVMPDVVIAAGGPHPSMYPEDTIGDPNIDYVVIGEGEETFAELLQALREGESGDVARVRGIVRLQDGEVVFNDPRPFIADMDTVPFPAWDLIDRDGYARRNSMANLGKRPYMGIFTSRACPYNCVYCHRLFGKSFRPNSAGYVLDMMESLVKDFGINEYEIYDDIFNWNADRMSDICDGILKRNLDLRLVFPNGLRGDILTEDQVGKLVDAGAIYVCLAVESASPRIQRLIRKNLNLDRMRETMRYFADRRIYTVGFFMLGFPTETIDEQRLTMHYALQSPLNAAYFFIATPFQGTEMYQMAGPEALKRAGADFADFDYFKGNYNMSDTPDDLFFKLQREAFRRFYLHPDRIWRILRDHPNKACLLDYLKITLRKVFIKGRGNVNGPIYSR